MNITVSDFETALNNNALTLAFQPIITMKTGHVAGFESFMRWTHPVHGPIPPGVFIPLAEESGLIVKASRWALKESCRALKRISGDLGYDANPFVSVNFSATDIDDHNFLEQLYTIISAVDIDPRRVQLEITEQLLHKDPENARATLGLCRKAGLGVAIDDFNTASSSLEFISSFHINNVKIDQIADDKVSRIIDQAHALGMSTSAEGIEDEFSAATLKAMGCDMAQGYYFARPMPETDLVVALRSWGIRKTA